MMIIPMLIYYKVIERVNIIHVYIYMVWWNHESYFHEHSGGTSMDNLRLLHLKPVPQGDLWLHRHYLLVNSHSYRKWPIYRRFTVPIKMEMFKLGQRSEFQVSWIWTSRLGVSQNLSFRMEQPIVCTVYIYIYIHTCACIYPKFEKKHL